MLYQIWTSVIFLINVNPDFQWPYEFELSLIKLRYAINKYALHELCEPSNNYDICAKNLSDQGGNYYRLWSLVWWK